MERTRRAAGKDPGDRPRSRAGTTHAPSVPPGYLLRQRARTEAISTTAAGGFKQVEDSRLRAQLDRVTGAHGISMTTTCMTSSGRGALRLPMRYRKILNLPAPNPPTEIFLPSRWIRHSVLRALDILTPTQLVVSVGCAVAWILIARIRFQVFS